MGEFLKYVSGEWSVISATPLTFVILAVLMAGSMYLVLAWYYSGRLETLRGRLEIRDDQIKDYKEKLSGATPEEAKARMDRLQAELDALKPRQLGPDRRQKITTAAIGRSKGKLEVGHDMSCADCAGYKGELIAAFKSAGWAVQAPAFMGYAHAARCGMTVEVANLNNLTTLESAVIDALEAASIDFEMKNVVPRSATSFASGEREADVIINVTTKLP